MNEPYIVKISDSDAMMFGCEADERVREFAAKFDGWEYESEFERTSYLLGTDVFIEVASEESLNEGILRAQIPNEKALDADGRHDVFEPARVGRQGAFARAMKFYAPSARMRTAARRICSLARDISPQRSCEAPLRTSRRRNLRALPGLSKPNMTAKTECSATSFAILRRKAKRGCGRTSASKFKARRIKFKI